MPRTVGFVLCTFLSLVVSQEYTQHLLTLNKCQVGANSKEIDYDVKVKEKNGQISVNVQGTLQEEVNLKNWVYSADVMGETPGGYVKYMDFDGNMCDLLTNWGKTAFERLEKAVDPPITKHCIINPGTYKLNDYVIFKEEMNDSVPAEGTFKIICKIHDPSGTAGLCVEMKLLIAEKKEK